MRATPRILPTWSRADGERFVGRNNRNDFMALIAPGPSRRVRADVNNADRNSGHNDQSSPIQWKLPTFLFSLLSGRHPSVPPYPARERVSCQFKLWIIGFAEKPKGYYRH
jgi:hypothetical protein